MMKDLFSWLQNEANIVNLNEHLYKNTLHKSLDKDKEYQKIANWIDKLLLKDIDIIALLKKENIKFEIRLDEKQSFIHAQYIEEENNKHIWINQLWIDKYKDLITEEEAVIMHLAHETYHILEEIEKPWYISYPYKKAHSISEACAMYFSQKIANLPYHPTFYTYLLGVKNEEYTKEELLKHIVSMNK